MAKVNITLINGATGEVVHEAKSLSLFGVIEVHDHTLMDDVARSYLLYQHDFVDDYYWPWTEVLLDHLTSKHIGWNGSIEYADANDGSNIIIYAEVENMPER